MMAHKQSSVVAVSESDIFMWEIYRAWAYMENIPLSRAQGHSKYTCNYDGT